jgi:hypothetical protein
MKKIMLMFLVVLPLIAGAQTKNAAGIPLVLSFDEKMTYKKFIVPSDSYLRIDRIYSEAEIARLKIFVKENGTANQNELTQSLKFSRAERENFSEGGSFFLPKYSSIEYDGVPVTVFCILLRYDY